MMPSSAITAIRTIMFLSLFLLGLVSGRRLDSTELLVGDWDLSVRCKSGYFTSDLFPPLSTTSDDDITSSSAARKRRQRNKTHACRLSIYSNGTFCLSPKQDTLAGDAPNQQQQQQQQRHLMIHGRWKLHSNPYCVTDRFYDELVLSSFERSQKEVVVHDASTKKQEETILQQGSFQLQCRLFGHFSAGRLSRRLFGTTTDKPYAKGRLSRGILFWDDSRIPSKRRILRGSFTGRRSFLSSRAIVS